MTSNSGSDPVTYAEVYVGVMAAIGQYTMGVDDDRPDDVAATFCADGTVTLPGYGTMTGRDEIRATYATMSADRPRRHFISNTTVTGWSAESASAVSDLLVLVAPEGSGWVVAVVGRYHDELRLDEGRWRFASRRLSFVDVS